MTKADVFNNLHGKIPKSNIVKILERLAEQNLVASKTYGKMTIYVAKQNKEDIPSPEDEQAMNVQIDALTAKRDGLLESNRQLSQSLSSLNATLTTDAARDALEQILRDNTGYTERLSQLSSGMILVSDNDRARINTAFNHHRLEWQRRRRLFRDIFATITEHFPGDIGELKEKLGIEDDPIPFEEAPL